MPRWGRSNSSGTAGPTNCSRDDEEVELVRWDLITVIQGLVLAGSDKVKDAVSGEVELLVRPEKSRIPFPTSRSLCKKK